MNRRFRVKKIEYVLYIRGGSGGGRREDVIFRKLFLLCDGHTFGSLYHKVQVPTSQGRYDMIGPIIVRHAHEFTGSAYGAAAGHHMRVDVAIE